MSDEEEVANRPITSFTDFIDIKINREPKWTENKLFRLLKNTYVYPECITVRQVGYVNLRWCDAIVYPIWKTKGSHPKGFEIKVSRSDWLRELKHPEKSEYFRRFCGQWYIVAPKNIVKVEELPDGWGLMMPSGNKLRKKKRAKTNHEPAEIPESIIRCIMRRAYESGMNDMDCFYRKEQSEKDPDIVIDRALENLKGEDFL